MKNDRDVIDLLAADVIALETDNHTLTEELEIAREMLSELLEITHQALRIVYAVQQ